MALLSRYYDKNTPKAVREIEAEDWAEAVGIYPEWAITSAMRWWTSDVNPDRRKRPIEGDIVARIKVEMRPLGNAEWLVRRFDDPPAPIPSPEPDENRQPTLEMREEIMRAAGFRPKTFGGSA